MIYIVWTAVLLIGALNVFVSLRAVHDVFSSPVQKSFQILIVWLLPVLGAFIAWRMLYSVSDEEPHGRRRAQHGLEGREEGAYQTPPDEVKYLNV